MAVAINLQSASGPCKYNGVAHYDAQVRKDRAAATVSTRQRRPGAGGCAQQGASLVQLPNALARWGQQHLHYAIQAVPAHHRASTCAAPQLLWHQATRTEHVDLYGTPACLFSCQRVDTDIPQPSHPAPDGWSCKGRGDDVRHPLITDTPALPKLCSRARAGGNRLGPQNSGHPAQMRPQCAPGLHCSTDCFVRLATGAPWGTQARCRWADLPVPAGLQALSGLQVLKKFAFRQKTGDTHLQAAVGRPSTSEVLSRCWRPVAPARPMAGWAGQYVPMPRRWSGS